MCIRDRDGVWECPGRFGPFEGRDALKGFFSSFGAIVHFCLHGHCNEEIEIDGDTANGRWSVIAALTYERDHGPEDTWSFLIYRARYVRTGGLWKFKRLEATARAEGPNNIGWVDWLDLPANQQGT